MARSQSHSHEHGRRGGDLNLFIAVAINVLLTVAQIVGGVFAGSLALVADALHNFNDALSLLLTLIARRIARLPTDEVQTYGYKRAELVAALINLTALVVVGLFLIYEAVPRFFAPTEVSGWIVIIVATIALVIDVATAALTYRMAKGELNVKAAFVHNVADALASVGVIVGGLLIIYFGWNLADPIIAVGISAYIIYQGVTGMRPAIRILMDAVPEGVALRDVVEAIEASDGVDSAHHVHLRSLSEHRRSLTAHVVVADSVRTVKQLEDVKIAVRERLAEQFGIEDVTLEFEVEGDAAEAGEVKTVVPPD